MLLEKKFPSGRNTSFSEWFRFGLTENSSPGVEKILVDLADILIRSLVFKDPATGVEMAEVGKSICENVGVVAKLELGLEISKAREKRRDPSGPMFLVE